MAFSQLLTRHTRTLAKSIAVSPPSTSPLLQTLTHSTSTTPLKPQIFEQNFSSGFTLLKLCRNPFHPGITIPFSRIWRSIHGNLTDTQVLEETEEAISPQITSQIIKESEKICKLLSTSPKNSSVESILETCGVDVTPALVLEVLKKLSNAGFLALNFFRWAEKQKGFKHTTESYNALIDSLGKIKQFKMIWVLVDSMRGKGLLGKDTFILIIRRYARAKRVEDAIEAFEKMERFAMKLDLSDFNRFLDVLCKSRQVVKAHHVFDKMKKRRFMPDKKSYTILLEGWGQQQNLLKLDEVYREMKDEGFEPDIVAYGIIMHAYCKARKVNQAVEKFQEMEEMGIHPSPHMYCILINGLGSEKRLGEALKFFEMSKAGDIALEAPTYNAVVGSFCWSMKFDEAFHMIDEMKRCGVGPNSRTNDIILHHLIKAGKGKEAYSVFKRMSNEQGCEPTLSTYEIIVRMLCNNRQLDTAVQVWDQMKAKGVLPGMHMFATMISSFCHENKLEDACNYFHEMLDLGIRPPASVFNNLKRALLDQGKKETVLILAQKLEAIRTTPIIG
ncbi:hypothetical protein Cgig2_000399 [Carnegiea gigantea]|uniref:Pentatricopeptide repeat-containing protein n=1 Tax=Carnegiea gigantea TaxID=171969 RepID=A0A9Q1K7K6_9CARY|nr:hypothetical protein Cgig2_000399 [Carnegiea gigantea]